MMKKIKKNRFITLVSAIVIAICCVFPCFSGNRQCIEGSADSFQLTDSYKALHGFNMLNPSIWDSTFFNASFEQIPDKPEGCYKLKTGSSLSTNTWHYLGQYDLPSSLSIGEASDVRFNFVPVSLGRPLYYKIKVEYFGSNDLLGSYEVTSSSGVSNLPPPLVISGFRFYIMFDSSTDFSSVVFEPYLGYFTHAYIWQPYVEIGGIPQDELDSLLEEARNQGYEEGKEYAKSGYFNDIMIRCLVYTASGVSDPIGIKPSVLYDGISLSPLYNRINSYLQEVNQELIRVEWEVVFRTTVPFNLLKFGLYSVVDYAQTTNSQGDLTYKRYTAEVRANNTVYNIPARFVDVENLPGFRLSVANSPDSSSNNLPDDLPDDIFNSYTFSIEKIKGFETYNLNDFLNFQFIGLGNSTYQVGYDNGYNQANIDNQLNREEIFNAGKVIGEEIGFTNGSLAGYAEGFAKASSSDPYSLNDFAFTLLDLPGRILYNWLNFDFLGFNLAGIVGLLISVVLIAYVWKKVF